MTPQRAKELLPIITAFAEGKTVQCSLEGAQWVDCVTLEVNSSCKYQIKPEPRVIWVNEYPDDCISPFGKVYDSAESAREAAHTPNVRQIKFIEVL